MIINWIHALLEVMADSLILFETLKWNYKHRCALICNVCWLFGAYFWHSFALHVK